MAAVLALVPEFHMPSVPRGLGRPSDWRLYAIGTAGFLLALSSPLLYYNVRVYGMPLTTGYQHHATTKFAAAHAQGLSGIGMPDPVVMMAMTVHPLMGIFWQSPILLLALAGWSNMRRTGYHAELWLSLSGILAYVALISGYYEWSGGLAYTPRHLIPILPLFAIPLGCLPPRWWTFAWCLSALSIAQHAIPAVGRLDYVARLVRNTLDANHHPNTFFVSTIWSACWPNLRAGLFLKNRGALFLPMGFATLLPLLVVEAGLTLTLYRLARRGEKESNLPPAGTSLST